MEREWCRGRMLGRGSSATVSLATARLSGEAFAVKTAVLTRSAPLRREQRILSGLASPDVISYVGFDITVERAENASESLQYYNLFIEYAPGGSLCDEIRRRGGRLEEDDVRSRACQILRGLSYLHERGIAHCDVKGQNVLIGADGRAKIADLGCARSVADDDDDDDGDEGVRDGCGRIQLRGTPMFMAPEVARGDMKGTAGANDVWALGCTVIEMATGGAPWPGLSDPIAVVHHVAFSSDVPEFPRGMSEEGKDFLSRCLRRDPEERWTAQQLLQHPFVAPSARCGGNDYSLWKTPKSILDQKFWASLEEEQEIEEFKEFEIAEQIPVPTIGISIITGINSDNSISERLRGLGGGELPGPDWAWDDDDWVIVRMVDDSREIAIEVKTGVEERSSSTGGGCDEEYTFSVHHVDKEEDLCHGQRRGGFASENGCVERW